MGVYVRRMKMPNACYECEFYNEVCPFDGTEVWYEPLRERADGCPLEEVHDHGDLIDRNVLMMYKGSAYDIDGHELYAVGTGTILRMPVVIPAEVSE